MLKIQRMKTLTLLFLAAAMTVLTVSPAMGEEVAVQNDDGTEYDANVLLSNFSESANHYYGSVYVREDGIWDADPSSNEVTPQKITVPGLSFDSDTCTLTLDNLCLGEIVDDFICPDKGGSLDIRIYDPQKQLTIKLKGHNFIGGYSNWLRTDFNPKGAGNSCVDSFSAYTKGHNTLKIEGDGDLQVIGNVELYYMCEIQGGKPVWYSYYPDGRNIMQYSSPYYNENRGGTGGIVGRYLKIGGEKPETYNVPEPYVTVSKNLGNIGGHTVSVCYLDNIPYQAAKIFKRNAYTACYNSKTGEYEFYPYPRYREIIPCPVNSFKLVDDTGTIYYVGNSDPISDKKNKVYDMEMVVYIDGKPVPDMFVTASFRNNMNVSSDSRNVPCFSFKIKEKAKPDKKILNNPKTKLEIDQWTSGNLIYDKLKTDFKKPLSSGYDKSFIKALNDYFKNSDNWISFSIIPTDIAETKFYSKALVKSRHDNTYWMTFSIKHFTKDGYLESGSYDDYYAELNKNLFTDYKKSIKIKKGRVTKFPLFLSASDYNRQLKFDKKYMEGKPDLKKDYHVTVSGNVLVVEGQGNLYNSIILPNP